MKSLTEQLSKTLSILERNDSSINWKAVRTAAMREYVRLREEDGNSSPTSFAAGEALEIAAKKFNVGSGVEGDADLDIMYINMGDTYDTTVLFLGSRERFVVGSWGDYAERRTR